MPKKGYKQTRKHRRKNREARIKEWQNPKHRKHMSDIHKGQHSSPQTEIKKGQHLSPNTEFKKNKHYSQKTEFKKGEFLGDKHPFWKGGTYKTPQGYIYIYKPNHPFCRKQFYVLEHRLVTEKHLCRYLTSTEVVHHINGNPSDNRIKNLMLFENNAEHIKYHSKNKNRKVPEEIKGAKAMGA
jgi:hypothetical protein